jgi:hypothetical protein
MTNEILELYVEFVQSTFRVLAKACPHRNSGWDVDCHHPDIDFDCMLCAPCNCPLLLVEKEEPETDLECFRDEDPEL